MHHMDIHTRSARGRAWNSSLSEAVIELHWSMVALVDRSIVLEIGYAISPSLRAILGTARRNESDYRYRTGATSLYAVHARGRLRASELSLAFNRCVVIETR